MRIQLVLISMLVSLHALAVDEKSMQELFKKYDIVIDDKKTELIDDIFTEKFIKDSGGKTQLAQKIKEMSGPKSKSEVNWQKGHKDEIYLAKVKFVGDKSSKVSTFRVIEVKGKPKIDGMVNDAD